MALSENVFRTAERLKDDYWLCPVFNCAGKPKLNVVQNPVRLGWQPVMSVEPISNSGGGAPMIPVISHSRSQLLSHVNEYEDGAVSFFVLADIYPQLFDFSHGEIARKSPTGWKTSRSGKMKYLWFPNLDDDDLEAIAEWKEKFEQYVLLGLNQHIEDYFASELDFCMALDFNFFPGEGRTIYGEAEYQLK